MSKRDAQKARSSYHSSEKAANRASRPPRAVSPTAATLLHPDIADLYREKVTEPWRQCSSAAQAQSTGASLGHLGPWRR
jgi:hypothetical protein